ncbi:dual specificity protein phosphatase -related [Anaeramoeba flamelloides]|uniref:Dual specificity protein phosphatase -related n=1 Tax=Anaeramoeba flamelloides TaxID=1746091 RepID=A0AAV7Z3E0_9EUKA|nr:dual specificity protein phosphatase -related [Anaeramoeba flamelloides]
MGNAINQIEERVYLGNFSAANDLDLLQQNKITHIVNLCGQENVFPEEFDYLKIDIEDTFFELIIRFFPTINKYIFQFLEKEEGNLFVHCTQGVSRSATALIAFFMERDNSEPGPILEKLNQKRDVIDPNVSFRYQLSLWYECNFDLTGDTASHQIYQKKLQLYLTSKFIKTNLKLHFSDELIIEQVLGWLKIFENQKYKILTDQQIVIVQKIVEKQLSLHKLALIFKKQLNIVFKPKMGQQEIVKDRFYRSFYVPLKKLLKEF